MRQAEKHDLRVVVFEGHENWVAQCLEFDIAAQATQCEDLPARFAQMLEAEVTRCERQEVPLFDGRRAAPSRYWAMWYGSMPVQNETPWMALPEGVLSLIAALKTRATPVPAI